MRIQDSKRYGTVSVSDLPLAIKGLLIISGRSLTLTVPYRRSRHFPAQAIAIRSKLLSKLSQMACLVTET